MLLVITLMFLFRAAQENPSLDQNRDYSDTERTRNGLPLQKIKHFMLLCNLGFGAQSQPILGNERNKTLAARALEERGVNNSFP
jgi:hypothetical protein